MVELIIPQPKPWWETFYDKATIAPKHAHGAIVVDGIEVASTFQCPHCGGHEYWLRDDVIDWCPNCSKRVCKKQACIQHCIPWERQMERIEQAAKEMVL